jgi:hypothetical protein
MARLYKNAELFSHVTEIGYMREATGTHGDTTLSANAAKGASTITVTSATNFADGDYLFIGAPGDTQEIAQQSGAPAGSVITLRSTLAMAHLSGEEVSEVTRTKLGDLSDDGVDVTWGEGDFNAITAATKRGAVGYLVGHASQLLEFSVINTNPENVAASLGIPEANVTGAFTAANPTKLDMAPDDFVTAVAAAWYFVGLRKDGSTVEIQAWGVDVDPNTGAQKFARGQASPARFRLRPTAGIRYLAYA